MVSAPCCDVVSLNWEATTPSPLNPQLSNPFRRVFRYGLNVKVMGEP